MPVVTQAKVRKDVFVVNPPCVKNYEHSKKVGSFILGPTLGKGSFATVKEAMHMLSGEKVAIKLLNKEQCKKDPYMDKHFRRESRLLGHLRHPGIIRLLEVMETKHTFYLVLELCPGNLLALVLKGSQLPEPRARRYVYQLILAVDYLHKAGVIHRDLKVENILLTENDNIKIIDFGLSTMVKATEGVDGSVVTQLCKTQCGSPAYAAPEVLSRKPYGHKADIWSIGVNLYAMVAGGLPFSVEPYDIKNLCKKMMNRETNAIKSSISEECSTLIHRFLDPNPEKRISLHEAIRHPWFNMASLVQPPLRPPPQPELHLEVVRHVQEQFDYGKIELIRLIRTNTPSPATVTYHLFYQKLRTYCKAKGLAVSGVKSVPQKDAKKMKVASVDDDDDDGQDSWIDMTRQLPRQGSIMTGLKSSKGGSTFDGRGVSMVSQPSFNGAEVKKENASPRNKGSIRWMYSRQKILSPEVSQETLSLKVKGQNSSQQDLKPDSKLGVRFFGVPTKLGAEHKVSQLPKIDSPQYTMRQGNTENESLQPNILSFIGSPNPNRKDTTGELRSAYSGCSQMLSAKLNIRRPLPSQSFRGHSSVKSQNTLRRSNSLVPVSEMVHYSLDLRTGKKRMISSDITSYMQDGMLIRERGHTTLS